MNDKNGERWGAATGYLVFVLGIAGAAFERGAPPANAPIEETLAFLAKYRAELLAQSLMFVRLGKPASTWLTTRQDRRASKPNMALPYLAGKKLKHDGHEVHKGGIRRTSTGFFPS